MPVDLLSGVRSANAQLIPVLQANAAARERERLRQQQERQNRAANILALGGAVAGGVATGGNPAGVAAGATLGNMVGRAAAGGPAPSVAETANVGASLYGLYGDSQQAQQNQKINQALTKNAVDQLTAASGGWTPGKVAESELQRQSLKSTTGDPRVAELLGPGLAPSDITAPGMPQPAAPTPEQERAVKGIEALRGMEQGGLSRVSPQTVAAVTSAFLPKKGDIIKGGPGDVFFRQTLEGGLRPVGAVPAKEGSQTFEVRIGRGPNAQNLGTGLSLDKAQELAKENPNSVIYKTSTEPSNTGEGTGTWMRFNAYADQRVAQINQGRQAANLPPMTAVESEGAHRSIVDELNRQDFQRETTTIDPVTMLPGKKPGLNLGPVEKMVSEAVKAPLASATPISPPKGTVSERKQLTAEQYKGFTGTATSLEFMSVLNENVGTSGFITGPAKAALQQYGFMKPDGTLDFQAARDRLSVMAQDIIKGIPSNFDVQQFQKTLPQAGNSPEANVVRLKQSTRMLARAMADQLDYATKFNLDLPAQSLKTAAEFGVDVKGIQAGKSNQKISIDKPIGIKMDPFVPKSKAEFMELKKNPANRGRWVKGPNGELAQI